MKVIGFKVDDEIYHALKKSLRSKNLTFRDLFEPIAKQLTQNNREGLKFTGVNHQNSSDLYIDLSLIQKTIQKIIKSCDFEKS